MSSTLHTNSRDKEIIGENTAFIAGLAEKCRTAVTDVLAKKGFEPIFGTSLESLPVEGFPFLHILDITNATLPLNELLTKSGSKHPCTCIIAFDDHSHSKAVRLLSKGAYALIRSPINPLEVEHLVDRHIKRVALYHEDRQQKRYLESLEQSLTALLLTPKKLSGCLYLSDFGQAIMTEFQNTLNTSGGSFFIHEGSKLQRVFSLDPGHAPEELALPLSSDSLFGQAQELRKPLLVKDLQAQKTGKPSGWDGYSDNSTLILPLTFNGGHILGFISLHNKRESIFSEHDVTIGSALASVGTGILLTLKELFASQERENRFRRFFLDSHSANAVIAPDSTILMRNPAFDALIGIGAEEQRPKFSDYLDTADSWEKLANKLHAEQHLYQYEFRVHSRKNKTLCIAGNLTARYDKYSNLADIYFSLTDITEKRSLEHELSHSLKMEAVGCLAGGVAHDFNNLIAVILGYAELLGNDLKDTLHYNDIHEIKQAGEKAAELAKQLCYFSRKQIERRPVINLNDSVIEMERMLRRLIGDNIVLYNNFNTRESFIEIDKGQIEQVIMNLVINARDALPVGGSIYITIDEKERKLYNNEGSGTEVILTIEDTGTGMTDDVKARIFDPFFSTKGQGKGTGLGLATVHAIMQTAGGRISVESVPGKGTRFILVFPKASMEPTGHQTPAAQEMQRPYTGTERILLMEDDSNIRNLLVKLLAYRGYSIQEAKSGEEAICLFEQFEKSQPFDLFIADLVIPGVTGRDAADYIRKTRPRLPVLFISGYGDEVLVKANNSVNYITDFIVKPFDNETLQQKVREILDNAREISDTQMRKDP